MQEQHNVNRDIRILLLEDIVTDAELVEYELRKEGVRFTGLRVDTREAFAREVREFRPDIILADYSLPRFTALDALRMLRAADVAVPLILVTGATSEEVAVECMREGADDYILKTSLKRLPTAVLNTLAKHRAERERERAEQALAEREHRFRALIENSSDVISILDRDGRVQYASPSSERILGYRAEDLRETVFFDLLHPDDASRFLLAHSMVLQEPGAARTIEFRIRHHDGSWRTLEGVGRHVGEAPVNGIVLNSRDITARKKAEVTTAAFSLLGQRLSSARTPAEAARILADTTRDLFGWHTFALDLYDPERDLILPVLSLEAAEGGGAHARPSRTASPPAPLMRRTLHEGPLLLQRGAGAAADGTGFLFPDLAPLPPSMMVVPVRNGERNIGMLSLQRLDAQPYTAEDLRTFQGLGDHCGGALERMKSAEALQESEDRYRRFFEDDLTGDFIATPDGRILACNPAFARIFGFATTALARQASLASLYPGGDEFAEFLRSLRERRSLEYDERELRRPDGRSVSVVQNAYGIFTATGELAEIKGYLFDDTERRTLQDQLRQIQKMDSIGTLASGIAHDFGNILNTVLGFAGQIRKHSGDPERIRKYGDTIERSARRGAELAGQLLSFVRNRKRENAPTDLGAVIGDVAALAEQTFPGTITIRTSVQDGLPPVSGHRGELYQVLLNLSVNARDAMPDGGTLVIEAMNREVGAEVSPRLLTQPARHCVELRVTDTGTGIPEHVRARIFDPFFTTKERGQGTGLGLSIVFGIVRSHKGSILVRSEVGRGTTFQIYLPAMESDAEQSTAPAPFVASQTREGAILVADDDEASRDLTREILEQHGHRVVLAGDGAEAVRICAERGEEIALAVLDMAMPRMDGAEAYRRVASMRPGFRAVFCTGVPDHPALAPLLESHSLRALPKPVTAPDLLAAIREILDAGETADSGVEPLAAR